MVLIKSLKWQLRIKGSGNMTSIKKYLQLTIMGCILGAFCFGAAASALAAEKKQLGFGHIQMPSNVANDEHKVKSFYFVLKKNARKIKKFNINYGGINDAGNDYVINVILYNCDIKKEWREPFADTLTKQVWSKDYKWKDSDGKERTRTVARYESEAYDVPGEYMFRTYIKAKFTLVDTKNDTILVDYSPTLGGYDEIDTYTSLVKNFYKMINKKF